MRLGVDGWPERDAIEKWLKDVGVMVKPEEAEALEIAVSRTRLEVLAEANRIIANLSGALTALAIKLREIENDSSYRGIWALAEVHGASYTGPNWEQALKAAEAVLQRERSR
jgi:hypothetical protein